MANSKITDLTAGNRPVTGDLFEMSQAPGSSPISRKLALEQVIQSADFPDIPPTTAHTLDDEFDGTSLNGKWTWVSQGSATIAFGGSLIRFLVDTTGAVSHRYITQAVPAGNWQITAKMSSGIQPASTNSTSSGTGWGSSNMASGICIRDSVSGKATNLYTIFDVSWRSYVQRFTTNTFSATVGYFDGLKQQDYYWLRIAKDSSNYYFSVSYDGVFFYQYYQEAIGAWLTADQVGILVDARTGVKFWATCDYFRGFTLP